MTKVRPQYFVHFMKRWDLLATIMLGKTEGNKKIGNFNNKGSHSLQDLNNYTTRRTGIIAAIMDITQIALNKISTTNS